MAFLHNIRTVAQYEAKTLRRSWFFRLFSIGALVIFTFLNIGMFSPIGGEPWNVISMPASVPLINLYLLNIGQAIVVIFLAADFLKRDKKLDTNEVLYTRSMSNFEYVIGKTWGILRLFLGLDILILLLGLMANITSKSMTIDFMAYLSYLLIICVPTILFSLGFAFVLMSVIRNQAITFLLLLGYAALIMFYLYFRMGSIFDYLAIGLPVFKSGIIGFDNLSFIINQRLIYLFLGLAMVFATILLFKRLPQSRVHRTLTFVFLFIFLAGSAVCTFNTYMSYRNSIDTKNMVIETNRQYENKNFASITDALIKFIHKGKSFGASANIKILNDNKEAINHYYFSLNPSLKVSKISSNGKDLTYKRYNQIIDVDPGKALNTGLSDSIIIDYSGTINEAFCYPNYNDNIKDNPYKIGGLVNVNKRQAFLTDNYVLLTPETHWYPVAGLNYYPSNPARIKVDFTRFILRAKSEKSLAIVSQGNMNVENGYSVYKPDFPLTGMTLAMGNYLTEKKKIDSVEYITYYFPGDDYYKKDLSEIKDTLSLLVSGIMRELETNFSTKYPFKTLSLVEVPVQFFSYPKKNTQTRAELQPSIVLLPEKLSTLDQAGFARQFKRQKRNNARNNTIMTDKELQVRIFNNFIRNTFILGTTFRFNNGVPVNEPTRYLLGPSFYFFKNNFYSSEYPVINAVFESHLQKVSTPGTGSPQGLFFMSGNLSDNDRANLILKGISLKDLLAKNPGSDTLRVILTIKGDYFFNMIRSKAGIEEFKTWFLKYIDDHRFQRINILQLNTDIREKFGFEFFPFLNDWYNGKDQPGFLFTNLKANEIVVNDRSRYQVSFIASNPEPVGGLFNISFRTGGPGARGSSQQMMAVNIAQGGGGGGGRMQISMQGRGMEAADISKIVYMGPHESKKIGIVLDAQPRAMMINTLFSKNIPGEINMPINDIIKSKDVTKEFQGEETLSSIPPFSEAFEIIVDNEDSGFIRSKQVTVNPLKRLLGIKNQSGETYQQVRFYNIPEYWQPVVLNTYFGKYVRSSVYTRAGTGDKIVTWAAIIPNPGYYDIYTFIGKTGDRIAIRTGAAAGPGGPGGPGGPMGQQQGNSPYKDFHFKIYHDEGVEEVTLDYENAESGWNKLGTYYLSPDTAKVILTNLSAGRIVLGDAIKWVKQK
jgi:hypothetical protein